MNIYRVAWVREIEKKNKAVVLGGSVLLRPV
jgi:hypothetical protein